MKKIRQKKKPLARLCILVCMLLSAHHAAAQESIFDKIKSAFVPQVTQSAVTKPAIQSVDIPGPHPDLRDDKCASNRMLNGSARTSEIDRETTKEYHVFLDNVPIKQISGLGIASMRGAELTISVVSKGLFEEFQAPIVNVIEKTKYEGKPGTAILGHTLTLGILAATSPIKSAQHAFGCTDQKIIAREAGIEESRPTGRSEWRDHKTEHTILVSGLGDPKEYRVSTGGEVHLDLLPQLMQLPPETDISTSRLVVKCLSCNTQVPQEMADQSQLKDILTLTSDLSHPRADEFEKLERRAQEKRLAQELKAAEDRKRAEFARNLQGRWATAEICLNPARKDEGTVYEMDGRGMLSATDVSGGLRRTATVQINPFNPTQSFEVSLSFKDRTSRSGMIQTIRVRIEEEIMQILEASPYDTLGGARLARFSSQMKCDHPKILARLREIENQEKDKRRRAQIEQEDRKRRAEFEEAERRRQETERKRRQEERDRLYKL